MNVDVSNSNYAEIWQNQRYWPINGWDMVSKVHFSDVIGEYGYDNFPQVDLPDGWEWIGDWEIDKSKRFGESDADGYMYATNFERLLEMIRSQTTMGTPSAASLVRRRCYVRAKKVVNNNAKEALIKSVNVLIKSRNLCEENSREKRLEWNTMLKFEASRLEVFTELAERCRIANNNSMELMKLLMGNLNMLREFLNERAALELEYAQRLQQLSIKYSECSNFDLVPTGSVPREASGRARAFSRRNTSDSVSSASGGCADSFSNKTSSAVHLLTSSAYNELHAYNFEGMNFTETELCFLDNNNTFGTSNLLSSLGFNSGPGASTPEKRSSTDASTFQRQQVHHVSNGSAARIPSSSNSSMNSNRDQRSLSLENNENIRTLDASCGFFSSISWTNQLFSVTHQNFSEHVLSGALSQDIASFLKLLDESLKKQLVESKKLSEEFRLAEEELKSASQSLQNTYHAVTTAFENSLEVWNKKIMVAAENGGEVIMSASGGTTKPAPAGIQQVNFDVSSDFDHLVAPGTSGKIRRQSLGCDYGDDDLDVTDNMPAMTTSLAVGTLLLHSLNSSGASLSLDSVPLSSTSSPAPPSGMNRFSSMFSRSFSTTAEDPVQSTTPTTPKVIDTKDAGLDDIWLKFQVYRSAVWNATENLQLILKSVKKNMFSAAICTSKTKLAFLNTMEVYTFEQGRLWSDQADSMTDACEHMLSTRTESIDVLEEKLVQRQKLNEAADNSVRNHGRNHMQTFQQVDKLLVGGLSLAPLPNTSTITLQGKLKSASISDVMLTAESEEELEEMWVVRYIVVTTDGYVHICKAPVNDVDYFVPPLQSFCIKSCEIGCASSFLGPIPHGIEIRPTATPNGADGIVLKTSDHVEAYLWSSVLADPLSSPLQCGTADPNELPQRDSVRLMSDNDANTIPKALTGTLTGNTYGNSELSNLQQRLLSASHSYSHSPSANNRRGSRRMSGRERRMSASKYQDNAERQDRDSDDDHEDDHVSEGQDDDDDDYYESDDDMDGLVPVIHYEFATAAVVPPEQEAAKGSKPLKGAKNIMKIGAGDYEEYDKDETFRTRKVNPGRHQSPVPQPQLSHTSSPATSTKAPALRGQSPYAVNRGAQSQPQPPAEPSHSPNKWIVIGDSQNKSPKSGNEPHESSFDKMSRRRSAKIEQYEAGVKQQQVAYSNRVMATRGQTLVEFGIGPDGSTTGDNSVSRMSQRFDTKEPSPKNGSASSTARLFNS